MNATTGFVPHTLNGLPMFVSDYVEFHRPVVQKWPHRMIVVHSLLLWVMQMKLALLPASTEGAEFVTEILSVVAVRTEK